MKQALVYSKENCSYCTKAKNLLTLENITYDESVIGRDITREDFLSLFPDQKSVPLIFVNGEKIGGYNELLDYLSRKPTFE